MAHTGEDLDLETRRLCPDGACIGVIGDDGRCRVCGLADDGSVVRPATREMEALADADADGASLGEIDDGEGDDDRELCPDGSCIGLIGANGKCKVCGRSRGS